MVFAVDGSLARRAGRVAAVMAIPALTWAPFVLAESETIDVRDHEIRVDPTSTLRALGSDVLVTPEWARPAQLAGGFALALLVTWRGRWHAAVLAAVAWRLLLEPGAHRYYTAGAVLGAPVVELVARPGAVPWRTAVLAIVLELTASPDAPEALARTARSRSCSPRWRSRVGSATRGAVGPAARIRVERRVVRAGRRGQLNNQQDIGVPRTCPRKIVRAGTSSAAPAATMSGMRCSS